MSDEPNPRVEKAVARVKAGETSAMEEIARILGVRMTPEQREAELRAQQARVAKRNKPKGEG